MSGPPNQKLADMLAESGQFDGLRAAAAAGNTFAAWSTDTGIAPASRTSFGDSKHGAALRHLPSGYHEVNTAWMWGALLAASMACWLHQLTAAEGPTGRLAGWGTQEGTAMIATLRHGLIGVPARIIFPCGTSDPAPAVWSWPARRDPRSAPRAARIVLTVRPNGPDHGLGGSSGHDHR